MRTRRSLTVVGIFLLAALVAVPSVATASPLPQDRSYSSPAAAADVGSQHDDCQPIANGTRANPASDRLGWEAGCWYDDGIDVNRTDGLNQTELDAVVARAMARVERLRDLEFNKTVPVQVLTQTEYRNRFMNLTGNTSTAERLHQNVKWEATFYVNETTDALENLRSTLANGTSGFYSPQSDRIRIVTSNPGSLQIAELTLGHELVHALQDQHFDTSYNRSTTDGGHASDGIVEGDADFVEAMYGDYCEDNWSCLRAASTGSGGGSVHVGFQINALVPYSEGGQFVQTRYQRGGWAAVNQVYENPPTSSEQVIHPARYPDETAVDLRIEHTTSGPWRMLDLPGGVDHATFGEGAINAMFWYASFQKSQAAGAARTVVIPYRHFFNFQPGTTQLRDVHPYNYSHPVTEGWAGDRLVPYVTNGSAETNETGYVWKLAWDSPADAREFATGYRTLLEYRGATPVESHVNTFRIPNGTEFGDAFYVTRTGDTVVVVNAPSVPALSKVHAGAAPEVTPTPTPTATPTPTPTPTPSPTPTPTPTLSPTTTSATTTTASGSGPAPGVVVTLLAATLALALAARRRR
ncbi:MAG: Hvo_1808 family surface protein [Haloarculaceae archaeon]